MTIYASVFSGITLFILLAIIVAKGWLASQDAHDYIDDEPEIPPCPPEFVNHVFSSRDRSFVKETHLADVLDLFRQERRRVALIWVAATSVLIRRILREHRMAARHSSNLKIAVELKIFAQSAALLLTCAFFYVTLQVLSPERLGGLAHLAQGILAHLADEHRSFQAALEAQSSGVAIR